MNKPTCSINGCDKPVHVQKRGWCVAHYRSWQAHGDPLVGKPIRQQTDACIIEGCTLPPRARDMCRKHYIRWYRHGEPSRERMPAVAKGEFWDNVVQSAYCLVWTGARTGHGYGHMRAEPMGPMVLAHRWAWEQTNGPIPDGMVIDHKCHNRACVNPDHLRLATIRQNNEYRKGAAPGSATGRRNVYRSGQNSYYVAVISQGKRRYLGSFADIEEADSVARAARAKLYYFPEFNPADWSPQSELEGR